MPERCGPPWMWADKFCSKRDILDHWKSLMSLKEDFTGSFSLDSPPNLDLEYGPGTGWRYVVGLATPEDNRALASLGKEFVMNHRAMFAGEKGYLEVDDKTWSSYLGFRPGAGAAGCQQIVAESRAARLNYHSLCHSGCTLKCEAIKISEESQDCRPSRRIVRQQSSTGSNGSNNSTNSCMQSSARREIVGYVSFTMEEGTIATSPRCSKRLKRKRGVSTGEYTKVNQLLVTSANRGLGLGTLLLTAVLHIVKCLDPSYARELFLTVIKRNEHAVALYQQMGLSIIGQNITHLAKARGDKSRPITWYQMCLNLEPPDSQCDNSKQAEMQ
eukprot:TRINITY_DN60714_c0_g1_i1.p1 TRINITY_DN60714_c0_g1~~TRINITY_DN60714_c0_g1_i1.p1  ORF type:complete len:329 (-),score=38.36 TRINITY_DN60714_c0_g1_i1:50-1036(-)